jgi:hypothetical protein
MSKKDIPGQTYLEGCAPEDRQSPWRRKDMHASPKEHACVLVLLKLLPDNTHGVSPTQIWRHGTIPVLDLKAVRTAMHSLWIKKALLRCGTIESNHDHKTEHLYTPTPL